MPTSHEPDASDDAEDIVRRVSWRHGFLDHSVISIADPAKPMSVELADRPRSFGALGRLPLEMQHMVLNMLDLQAIMSISRVSVYGRLVVQSLPAYSELLRHAPEAVTALIRTGLAGLHSMALLRAALRSPSCEGCLQYGAYLFLPTGTRCCWECLQVNPSFRAVTPQEAKRYFALKDKHVQQLPVLHTLPGNYGSCHRRTKKSRPLVSAVSAKELGVRVHGSAERLAERVARRLRSSKSRTIGRYYQRVSSDAFGGDTLAVPGQGGIPAYDFVGLASVPFPSLGQSGALDKGLWCKGCNSMATMNMYGELDLVDLATLVPPGRHPDQYLVGISRRARSRAGFLEHVKHCYGAQRVITT